MITKPQSGNALWFILIAVALLAALSVVLSRGSSSVDQSGNVEQNRIKISQIMRYAKSIEAGIQNLQLNGCSENEISFQNTTDLNYNNTNSPSDESCHIFQPEGAGLEWREFDGGDLSGAGSNIVFMNSYVIEGLENDTAPAGTDLLMGIKVSQSLCAQINKELKITTTTAGMTTTTDLWDEYFIGSFSSTYNISAGNDAPDLTGQTTGCMIDDNSDYVFYHVILTR